MRFHYRGVYDGFAIMNSLSTLRFTAPFFLYWFHGYAPGLWMEAGESCVQGRLSAHCRVRRGRAWADVRAGGCGRGHSSDGLPPARAERFQTDRGEEAQRT